MNSTIVVCGMVADGDDPDRRVGFVGRHLLRPGFGYRSTNPDAAQCAFAPLVRQFRCAMEALFAYSGIRIVVLTGAIRASVRVGDLTMMLRPPTTDQPGGCRRRVRWIRRGVGGIARSSPGPEHDFHRAINGPAAGSDCPGR